MSNPPPYQPPTVAYAVRDPASADRGHLKALAICHWVMGTLVGLGGCFGILYLVMGSLMLNGTIPMSQPQHTATTQPFDERVFVGWMFIITGSLFCLVGWTVAALTIYSGFCINRHRRRVFSLIIAGVHCAFFPLGTALGVFTIIVLVRESVRQLYDFNSATAAATPHAD